MRNPVISLPFFVELSDIPEWIYAEVFGTAHNLEPTPEDYKTLYEYSPISMNKDIKSSVLLMLGAVDRRVPPGSGVNYYKILKSKGVDISMAWYPEDAHALASSSEVEFDNVVKIMAFIEEKNV